MLHGTLAFLVLVAFAVVGSEVRNLLARRGLRAPGMEGLSFLLIGLALGDRGLGLFPADLLATLRPVVLLGLAWVGLVFGLQLDLTIIRQLKGWHLAVALVVPCGVGGAVVAAALLLDVAPALAVGLGAIAMVSSPSAVEGLARGRSIVDPSAFRLLKLIMAFAGIPAVVGLAAAAAMSSPAAIRFGGTLSAWELAAYTAFVGIVVGYAMIALVRGVREHLRLLTLVAGAAATTAGATAVLGISGLPAAAVVGAVLVNRCLFPHRLLRVAHTLERPMLVALLVLVGASWHGPGFSWIAFGLMSVGRALALLVGGAWLASRARRHATPVRVRGLGLGLLTQGELAVGILVALTGTTIQAPGLLEAVVAAIALNQLAGRWWLRHWLFTTTQPHPRGADL